LLASAPKIHYSMDGSACQTNKIIHHFSYFWGLLLPLSVKLVHNQHMKKAVFIGNRTPVLKVLQEEPEIELVSIWALEGSVLQKTLAEKNTSFQCFHLNEKKKLLDIILRTPFDILISNGCPFKLPISRLKRKDELFINSHPSYLPYLKGMHPINGVFFHNFDFWGATTHYMDDGIDSGPIIAQKKYPKTPDLDIGLLYQISFDLEGEVFYDALKTLKAHNYEFSGIPQSQISSHYTRHPEDMILNFKTMSLHQLLCRIHAFGVSSQGARGELENQWYQIYEAEPLTNPYALEKFSKPKEPGKVLCTYDNDRHLLVQTLDGILKINAYVKIQESV
jgi:methionyl-tRNA formyltransferase